MNNNNTKLEVVRNVRHAVEIGDKAHLYMSSKDENSTDGREKPRRQLTASNCL